MRNFGVYLIGILFLLPINCKSESAPESVLRNNNNNPRSSNSVSFSATLSLLEEQSLLKWTSSAFKFFDFHRCTLANIGSNDECFKLSQIQRSQVAIYLGRANNNVDISSTNEQNEAAAYSILLGGGGNPTGKLNPTTTGASGNSKRDQKVFAILPDSNSVRASGPHDAILALDPYPNSNFGHLLGLFYLDFGIDQKSCKENHQIYTADQLCITVAKKPRCPNLLERHTGGLHPRRCHVDFLPTVRLAGNNHPYPMNPSSSAEYTPQNTYTHEIDLLECIFLPGFAPCPMFRSVDDTDKVLCEATHTNSKRCDTSYTGVGTRCKLFQTCDRAVLIGGGWNRLHSSVQSLNNMYNMEDTLKKSGFLSENIKVFYANGQPPNARSNVNVNSNRVINTIEEARRRTGMYSSAMKTALRGHLRTMCETRHCADSLFIYLNNPTTIEGDMLLWDVDYNGIADDLETYTAKELITDISGCEAKRVIVVADQSNSDILLALLKQSSEHPNVVLFTAGLPNQLTTNGELTNVWANNSHPVTCLENIQQMCRAQMKNSNPSIFDASFGNAMKLSVIGAPCDLNPPLSSRELRSLYQGCQNVPTSVWFSFNFDGITEDDDDGGESDESSQNSRRGQ